MCLCRGKGVLNRHEVIIDNDWSSGKSEFELAKKMVGVAQVGFAYKDTLYPGDNPFKHGTSLLIKEASGKVANYKPDIPQGEIMLFTFLTSVI